MNDTLGIAILDHLPLGVEHISTPGRHCTFVGQARQGELRWAAGMDIACALARFNLGLDPPNQPTVETLAGVVVDWEAAKDLETARRFIEALAPLPFGERVFVYGPLSAMPFPPDLVLLVLRPNEAMEQLLAIATATGMSCGGHVGGLGAMCGECTAIPLLTNKAMLSPGCPGSRREAFLAEDEMLLSMPYQLYSSTVVSSR
jgi:uncharacterized protein (DUF169 family)